MVKVKLLKRVLALKADKGAVVEVNDKVASSMVARNTAIFYTPDQAEADAKADEAQKAREVAEAKEVKAKEAAQAEAARTSKQKGLLAGRVPDPLKLKPLQ